MGQGYVALSVMSRVSVRVRVRDRVRVRVCVWVRCSVRAQR